MSLELTIADRHKSTQERRVRVLTSMPLDEGTPDALSLEPSVIEGPSVDNFMHTASALTDAGLTLRLIQMTLNGEEFNIHNPFPEDQPVAV